MVKINLKELFNKDTMFFWICILVAGLFTYGKYFVETTELGKMEAGLTAMLWILLGLIITYIISTQKLIKKLAKTRTQKN